MTGNDVSHMKADLGRVLAKAGRTSEARRILDQFQERGKHAYVSPVNAARIYLGLNETEAALDSIEQSYNDRSIGLIWLYADPVFDEIREEPRFQDVLRKTGLADRSLARENIN